MYENSIIAANSYLENDEATKAVIDEIDKVYLFNDTKILSADDRSKLNILYEDILKHISKQTVI
jgi:hypothetical protein